MPEARARLAELWAQMKDNGFTGETVEALAEQYLRELVDSGAYARNILCWNLTGAEADCFAIVSCAERRFEMLDLVTQALCETDERMMFLGGGEQENGYAVAIGEWLGELRERKAAEDEEFSL